MLLLDLVDRMMRRCDGCHLPGAVNIGKPRHRQGQRNDEDLRRSLSKSLPFRLPKYFQQQDSLGIQIRHRNLKHQ